MNFIIANGVVVVPVYGTPTQDAALAALQEVFPTAGSLACRRAACSAAGPPAAARSTASPSRSRVRRWSAKRSITVAAIQTSYGSDMKANIAKTAGFVREAAAPRRASRAAVGAVPGHLLSARARTRNGSRRPIPWREHPCVIALEEARAANSASSSRSRSSRRMGRAITTASRSPTRTAKSSASIARATFPTGPAIRRSTTSARATPASRPGRRKLGQHRRRHLLGPVVPGVCARHGAAGRRGAVLSDRYRLGAL